MGVLLYPSPGKDKCARKCVWSTVQKRYREGWKSKRMAAVMKGRKGWEEGWKGEDGLGRKGRYFHIPYWPWTWVMFSHPIQSGPGSKMESKLVTVTSLCCRVTANPGATLGAKEHREQTWCAVWVLEAKDEKQSNKYSVFVQNRNLS